ncbi:osmotically inducible protein C [Rhodovibrio salinarum]|uniref:Osmotically inducible protein C n=1 Tax=Rhodovibrio salinarum TaxID=1087 RepID=A0A934V0U7_9PROT|nr:bifunctional alpha/beta hydrolase/OsmC family protein [Rhodovibrio salinarum]MBK1698697.1 osmotically inducible protein C [Rhodovibrio salinarum]
MLSERVSFPGSQGHELAARLDRPEARPRAYALFAHCFTCTKDLYAAQRIAAALAEQGVAVLRFDFTGLGHSEGEFANTDFTSNVDDLVQAADFLARAYDAPQLLIGHSLGGGAVIAAARRIPAARAVATIGAPADPEHIRHLFADKLDQIEAQGTAEVALADRRFTISRRLLEDIAGQTLHDDLAHLKKALLVFHAPRDEVVGIDNASTIFTAARHPKSFISLDDADHLLRRKADAVYVARTLAAWAERYLETPETDDASAATPSAEGEVVVQETGAGLFQNAVRSGHHRLLADEPREAGGTDTGPSPYDFLLTALGACTSMTLRMYASHKNLSLARVTVRLRHQKIHAEDSGSGSGKADLLTRRIRLEGDLTAAQRQRLLEIADKCPVHRTLEGDIRVRSELDTPDSLTPGQGSS